MRSNLRNGKPCRYAASRRQLRGVFLAMSLSAWLLLFAIPAFAANGYQETVAMWQKLETEEVAKYSLLLQNFYAEVESQVGSDKSRLNQEFSRRLAEKYPGSSYFNGMSGILAVNNYTQITYNTSWKINSIQQRFGGLQKVYDVHNQILQISNGPNRISIKIDTKDPEKSLFTSADIPAISVTAQRISEKNRNRQGLPQPLKNILNDVYADRLAGLENMRMDKLAEKLVTNDETRQQVLVIADEIYSGGGSTTGDSASLVAPMAASRPALMQVKNSPNLFKLLPWFFWPAIVVIGGVKAFTSSRQRRPQTKLHSKGETVGDFSRGERNSLKDPSRPGGLDKTAPVGRPLPQHQVANGWTPEILGVLEWKRFETVCAEFFRLTGYVAKETGFGADGGIDIWVYKEGDERPFGIVQCKAWNASRVGVTLVRELCGVMSHENIANGMLVTSGLFTSEALAFAEGKRIRMISGDNLLAKIRHLSAEKQFALLQIALEGDYWTPTCSHCGIKMLMKQGVGGKKSFWGCVNFPKCKATLVYKQESIAPVAECDW